MRVTFLFIEGKSVTNIVDIHNQLMHNNSLKDNLNYSTIKKLLNTAVIWGIKWRF